MMDLFRLLYLGSEEKEPFHVFSSSPKREKSVSGEEIFVRNKRALIALAKEHKTTSRTTTTTRSTSHRSQHVLFVLF